MGDGMIGWMSKTWHSMDGMTARQKAEHIGRYYWYHILLACLALGLLVLLIYHLTWGRRETVFTCAVVNQQIDYQRDARVSAEFASVLGADEDEVVFDSDYQISYGSVRMEATKTSTYEKFFMGWAVHELDAAIMPLSFRDFCEKQGGEFAECIELTDERILDRLGLVNPEHDPLVLVLPADSKHPEAGRRFLRYVEQL